MKGRGREGYVRSRMCACVSRVTCACACACDVLLCVAVRIPGI